MKLTNEQIVAALLQHKTVQATAAALEIAPRTVYDRMQGYEFKVLYNATRSDIVRKAAASFDAKVNDAIETIAEIMQDKSAPHNVRLQASLSIIACAEKFANRLKASETELGSLQSEAAIMGMFSHPRNEDVDS